MLKKARRRSSPGLFSFRLNRSLGEFESESTGKLANADWSAIRIENSGYREVGPFSIPSVCSLPMLHAAALGCSSWTLKRFG